LRLVNGSRVMIVGGGPAGSFSALHLLRFAGQAGLKLEISIFEARDFSQPGPGGCNKCAGILSSTLVEHLASLDLALPHNVVQAELDAYILHLEQGELLIRRPDPARRIVSVYRGSGPRLGRAPYPQSFDGWLLEQAQARGVRLRRERVRAIRAGLRPMVVTARHELEAELVIVATGVNSRAPLEHAWGYRPPRTETMAQDEILLPGGLQGSHAHIFFDPPGGLIFGALIPKGPYANISLLGHRLPPEAVAEFIEGHNLSTLSPQGTPVLCGCTPRVAVSASRGYYHDRMVAVGDAAVTRLYKDGIGAAYLTAEAAARTAILRGIGRADFARSYRPACRRIVRDNTYGRLLFRLWALNRRSAFLVDAWRRAVLQESRLPPAEQIHRRVLWGMFTGDDSYRRMFWLSWSRAALAGLLQGAYAARTAG